MLSELRKIGPGQVVLVVGPSGAGKDALLDGANKRLTEGGKFVFPKRVVSRTPDHSEDHASLSASDFVYAEHAGAFAVTWQAHDLCYGIPVSMNDDVQDGRSVVFNASRTAIPFVREHYSNVRVVLIDAPTELRADRIASRGRETRDQIDARLARKVRGFDESSADFVIQNTGTKDEGIERFVSVLQGMRITNRSRVAGIGAAL